MTEETKEQPIIINTKEQVQTLLNAFYLAEEAERYEKHEHGIVIYVDDGKRTAEPNHTLSEYIKRAEREVVKEQNQAIIKKAESMIEQELTNIKELLK
jgi:hypothetical protein